MSEWNLHTRLNPTEAVILSPYPAIMRAIAEGGLSVPQAFRHAASEAFMTGARGPKVNALREALWCLDEEVWRGTPEYEERLRKALYPGGCEGTS